MAIINPDRVKAELLRFYCASHWGFDVVATEHNGHAGIAAVTRTKPELLLVSLNQPDVGAAEVVRALNAASPSSKIIGQVSHCHEYLLHQLSGAGCHSIFLDTEEGLESLGWTIDQVRQGMRAISAGIEQRQQAMRANPAAFPRLLSKREAEVLVCIGHAMSDEEIAQLLGLSRETALSHRKKIMNKLGIHRTPKLIRYCTEKGFASVAPAARSQPGRLRPAAGCPIEPAERGTQDCLIARETGFIPSA